MNLLKHVDFHLVQFLSLTTVWSFQGDYVIIDLKYKTKAYIRSCYHKNALVSYHTIVTVTITISKNKNVLEWKYLRNTIMICIFPKTYTTPQSRLWRYQYVSLMIKFNISIVMIEKPCCLTHRMLHFVLSLIFVH